MRRITDLGGRSYLVTDYWETRFEAEAFLDARLSRFN